MLFNTNNDEVGFEEKLTYWLPVQRDPCVLALTDGGFLRSYDVRGPHMRFASDAESTQLSAIIGTAFRLIADQGWSVWTHGMCSEQTHYLPRSVFPDPTTALMEEEARRRYTKTGAHFESAAALTIAWKPQQEWADKYSALFYEGEDRGKQGRGAVLRHFIQKTDEVTAILRAVTKCVAMNQDELFTYLCTCVNGLAHRRRAPRSFVPWRHAVVDQEVWGGEQLAVGRSHLRTIAVDGFPPGSQPHMTEFFSQLGFPYRVSHRFNFIDQFQASTMLDDLSRKHDQKKEGLRAVLGRIFHGDPGRKRNTAAEIQAGDAAEAKAEQDLGDTFYGLYTQTVSIWHTDKAEVERRAGLVEQLLRHYQFGTRIETMNAEQAHLGGCPGQYTYNCRTQPIHILNLADFVPLTSFWNGSQTISSPFFPPDSPAVMMATTEAYEPFYFSPFVGDMGHVEVTGPGGSGKTTFLGAMAANWYGRYPNAGVFCLDMKYGMYPLCKAVGGVHYDVGGKDQVGMVPYAHVDREAERRWALRWTINALRQLEYSVTERQENEIWDVLTLLGSRSGRRSMTDMVTLLQDKPLRARLRYYCRGGGAGDLFDSGEESPLQSRFIAWEMMHLFKRGPQDLIPATNYIAHIIEEGLDGRPTAIFMEEAWAALLHEDMGRTVEERLRTIRDKNGIMVFASQSLSEIERSTLHAILVTQMPTKIFAPDANAEAEVSKTLYRSAGLNDKQITALTQLLPKSDYLMVQGRQSAEFKTEFSRGALAFLGKGGVENVQRIRRCIAAHDETWPYHWLLECQCPEEAAWWIRAYEQGQQPQEEAHASLFSMDEYRSVSDRNGAALQ